MKYLILVALALGGCASNKVPEAQPVKLIGTDFCLVQRSKLTWDVKDTRPTIQGIRKLNAKWDDRCGKQAASAKYRDVY